MDLDRISFETPSWVVNGYYIIGTTSIIFNFFGIYLILFQSGRIGNFKYFLLWFQVCCTLVDVFVAFFLQPISLLPVWGGYSEGLFWKFFGISPHITSMLVGITISEQYIALTMCFIQKHQAIAMIGTKYILSKTKQLFIFLFLQVWVVLFATLFYSTGMDRTTALNVVKEKYPTLLNKFLTLDTFLLYLPSRLTYSFMASALIFASLIAIFIVTFTFNMLSLLKKYEQNVSDLNFRKHKAAIKSLIAQFLTCGVAVLPPVLSGFSLLFDSLNFQTLSSVQTLLICTHSTVNCVIMIITYPPYRGFVKKSILNIC